MEKRVHEWVSSSPAEQLDFRKAVHITLMAISICEDLSESMVMKGGMLMGIGYGSSRYTTDIDFSTGKKLEEVDVDEFRNNLNERLIEARVELLYNIDCRVQKVKVQPNKQATFPSLKITIGYANKGSEGQLKRLENGQSPNTISIDYSFNEETGSVDSLNIDGDEEINVYSLESMISEKYRSVLQQVKRDRSRRQDIYDLHYLITNHARNTHAEKTEVLELLFKKSSGKEIEQYLNISALDNEEIMERSEREYHSITDEIEGDLPDFKKIYEVVNGYYKSLPWEYH